MDTPMEIVRISGLCISVTSNGNSFHTYNTLNIVTVSNTGFISGKVILVHKVRRLHPSMIAASSISAGKSFKNPTNNSVLKDIEDAASGSITDTYLFTIPSWMLIRKIGNSNI